MKITKSRLQKIIKEEIENVKSEGLKGGSIAGSHPLRWLRYVLSSDEPMNAMNAWFGKQAQIRGDFHAALDNARTEEDYRDAVDKHEPLRRAEKDPIDAWYGPGRGSREARMPTKMFKAVEVYNQREEQDSDEWRKLNDKVSALGDKFRSSRYAREAGERQEREERRHREVLAQIEKDRPPSREQPSRRLSDFEDWQKDDSRGYNYMTRMEESKMKLTKNTVEKSK